MTYDEINERRNRRGKRPLTRREFLDQCRNTQDNNSDEFFDAMILLDVVDDVLSTTLIPTDIFEGHGGSFGGGGADASFDPVVLHSIGDAVSGIADGVGDVAGDAAETIGAVLGGIFDN